MHRIWFIGFLVLLLFPFKVKAIAAESAILIDGDSGRILYQKDAKKEKLIASTTKIMTALVAIENGNLNKKIKVGEEILQAYGSAIYVEMGEKITLKDLLYGLMLRSGNDAALVIAHNVASNEEDFVKLMNQKAKQLDMQQTIFYNPHGLENQDGNGNTSTAYDMAHLGGEFILGGKTGFTKKARRTLVSSANKNNGNLIAVTLNDPNDFQDHQNLYETYFSKYHSVLIFDTKKDQIQDEAYANKILYLKKDVKIMLTKEEEKNIKININLKEPKILENSPIKLN